MEKGDASFPKFRRILKREDFRRIMKTGIARRDNRLACQVCIMPGGPTRIGIVVSKKFGNAVKRNRIKRLIREAFRLTLGTLPEGLEVVCTPRVNPEYRLEDFQSSLKELLGSIVTGNSGHASANPHGD